jgi:hypothetical protein
LDESRGWGIAVVDVEGGIRMVGTSVGVLALFTIAIVVAVGVAVSTYGHDGDVDGVLFGASHEGL